jgi:hypothetical protein
MSLKMVMLDNFVFSLITYALNLARNTCGIMRDCIAVSVVVFWGMNN